MPEMDYKTIRRDLLDIRFYYTYRKDLTEAASVIYENAVSRKVEKYNRAVVNAPIRLYHLYYELYVKGNTQQLFADTYCFCVDYIKQLNQQLIEYISTQ